MFTTTMAREKALFFQALETLLTGEKPPFPRLAERYKEYLDDAVEWEGGQPDDEYRYLATDHILGMPVPSLRTGREDEEDIQPAHSPRESTTPRTVESPKGAGAKRRSPINDESPVPLEMALWNADEVAGFLRVRRRHCTEFLVLEPDFPRPIVLPSSGRGRRGQKVWKAKEVVEWAERRR